jgi:hypothetical protein
MADKIALEFDLTADKAQMTLGELEKGFDEMKDRLKKVGRGSEEFKQLSTAMAQTTAEIKNIELGFEGLDREQIASELGSVAGGIGDITASLVLLGGENETIEQIGASIEKAMAISMGFKGAIEGLSSASKLYNNIVKQGTIATIAKSAAEKAAAAGMWLLTTAQTAFNLVASMNPIALVVMAVTALIAGIVLLAMNIDKVVKFALYPFEAAINAVKSALVALGLMEESAAEKTKKAEEEKARAALESAEKRTEATEKLIKDHKKMTDSIVEDMDWEIRKRQANGEDTKKIEADKLQFLIDSAKKQKELQQQKIKDLAAEEWARLKTGKFTLKGLKETAQGIKQALDEAIDATNTIKESEKDLTILTIQENKKRREARKEGAADRAMARDKEQQAKKDALMEDIELDEKKATLRENEINATDEFTNNLIEINKSLAFQKEEEHQKELARIEAERQAKIEAAQTSMDLALTTLNAISDVSNAYADRDLKAEEDRFNNLRATKQLTEKQIAAEEAKSAKIKDDIRKRQFENDKKMQIAMAAINGAQALTSIFAQYPKFDGGFAMIAALASSVITTAATIAKIKATTFQSTPAPALPAIDSGDGGAAGASTASGGAAITPVSNTSTILGGQQVFVTETDITNTQNNVSVIEESATF